MEKTAILLGCRNDGYKEDERIITCLTSMVETFDERGLQVCLRRERPGD